MMVRRYNQNKVKVAQFVPWKQKKTREPAQIVPEVQVRIRLSGEIYDKIMKTHDSVSGFINFALLQHFSLYEDIPEIRRCLSEIGEYMMKNQKPVKVAQKVPELMIGLDEAEILQRLRGDRSLKTMYTYVKEVQPAIILTPKEHLEIEKYYTQLINIIENE